MPYTRPEDPTSYVVPVLLCPHWAPGRITLRERCTSCAAEASEEAR